MKTHILATTKILLRLASSPCSPVATAPGLRRRIAATGLFMGLILIGTNNLAGGTVESYFASGDEGWKVVNLPNYPETSGYSNLVSGPYAVEYQTNGGLNGGCIKATDQWAYSNFYFSAPARFLGNKSNYYGGTLSFSKLHTLHGHDPFGSLGDVVLVGNDRVLVCDVFPDPTACTGWTNHLVRLDETARWRLNRLAGAAPTAAEIQAVLAQLSAIYIRGEFFDYTDDCWLDNVVLADPAGNPANLGVARYIGVEVGGTVGRTYRVEARSALGDSPWMTLTNLVLTAPRQLFIDVESSAMPSRFYRLLELQP